MAGRVAGFLDDADQIEQKTATALHRKGVPLSRMRADVLLVVGGDGTMLKTFMQCDIPLLGINAGTVGFLTEVNGSEVQSALTRLRSGNYRIDSAIKLRSEVSGSRMPDAVNEAVVHSADIGKVRHFRISIDGRSAGMVRADGIIISTPTGSTSYSLAAGGPIADPSASVLVLTPIAPYGISSRPIVCSTGAVIHLTVEGNRRCKLVIDGQVSRDLDGGEELRFTASENRARFVRLKYDFYRRIHSKLTV